MSEETSKQAKREFTVKDGYLLLIGVLLSFMMQLAYDSIREEPLFRSIASITNMRAILAVICAVVIFWMLRSVLKEK
jgi:hypothetical protein